MGVYGCLRFADCLLADCYLFTCFKFGLVLCLFCLREFGLAGVTLLISWFVG